MASKAEHRNTPTGVIEEENDVTHEDKIDVLETPFGLFNSEDLRIVVESIRDAWCGSPPPHVPTQRTRDIEEFFGEGADIHSDGHHMSMRRGLMCFHAISSLIEKEYEVLRTVCYAKGFQGERPPSTTEVSIGPKSYQEVLSDGMRFIQHRDSGRKFIVEVRPHEYDADPEAIIIGDRREGKASDLWKDMYAWFYSEGPLKGKVINAKWKFIPHENVELKDVVMDDNLATTLDINVFQFLDQMQALKERGLSSSRGILISGPPGTGKTMFCTAIMSNRGNATVVYVTSEDIERPSDIAGVFNLARNLSPSIVIIEDIDTLGGMDRTQVHGHPLLGELLNSLNGAERNSGVVTVATSNFAHHLDAALRDRPGRFDLMVELANPNKELRQHLLKTALEKMNVKVEFDVVEMAKRCDGYTGAWIVELLTQSLLLAHHHYRQTCGKKIRKGTKEKFTQGLIDEAYELVEARRGFAKKQPNDYSTGVMQKGIEAIYG